MSRIWRRREREGKREIPSALPPSLSPFSSGWSALEWRSDLFYCREWRRARLEGRLLKGASPRLSLSRSQTGRKREGIWQSRTHTGESQRELPIANFLPSSLSRRADLDFVSFVKTAPRPLELGVELYVVSACFFHLEVLSILHSRPHRNADAACQTDTIRREPDK